MRPEDIYHNLNSREAAANKRSQTGGCLSNEEFIPVNVCFDRGGKCLCLICWRRMQVCFRF